MNDVDEIIIFFDQSASINDYDPKMISRKWLVDFSTTFNNACKVTLFGFDDRLYEYGHVTIHTKSDVEILLEKISLIESHGLTTNLEIPFQHLLTLDNRESLKAVVISSDWEPEIWDEKRWYLSKSVRDDQRYDDLTRNYYSMKSQGESPEQIYKELYPLYQARNLELIEERLALVKEKMGEKLFLLDIYGELEYFARWVDILDADSISISSQSELLIEEGVRNALMIINKKLDGTVHLASPAGREQRPVTTSITEPSDKIPVSPIAKTAFKETEEAFDQEQRQMTTSIAEPSDKIPVSPAAETAFKETEEAFNQEQIPMTTSITEPSDKIPLSPVTETAFKDTEKAASNKLTTTIANRDSIASGSKELLPKEKPGSPFVLLGATRSWWLVLLAVIVIVLVIKYNSIILGPIAVAFALRQKSKSLEKIEHEIGEKQAELAKLEQSIAGKSTEREALDDELKEYRADSLLRIEFELSAKKTKMEASLQEEQRKQEEALVSELAEKRTREHETLEGELQEHRTAEFSKLESELSARKAEMEAGLQEEQKKREEGLGSELAEKRRLDFETLAIELKEHRTTEFSKMESELSARKAEMEAGLQEEQKKREEGLGSELAERRKLDFEKLEGELKVHRADVLAKVESERLERKAEMEAMIQEIKTHPEEYLSRELAEKRRLDFEKLKNEIEEWYAGEMETLRALDDEIREKKAMTEILDARIIEREKLRRREEYLKDGLKELRIAEMEKLDTEIQQKRELLQKELEEEFSRKKEL